VIYHQKYFDSPFVLTFLQLLAFSVSVPKNPIKLSFSNLSFLVSILILLSLSLSLSHVEENLPTIEINHMNLSWKLYNINEIYYAWGFYMPNNIEWYNVKKLIIFAIWYKSEKFTYLIFVKNNPLKDIDIKRCSRRRYSLCTHVLQNIWFYSICIIS